MTEQKKNQGFQEEIQVIDLTDETTLRKFMEECRLRDLAEPAQETAETPFLFDGQLSLFDKC